MTRFASCLLLGLCVAGCESAPSEPVPQPSASAVGSTGSSAATQQGGPATAGTGLGSQYRDDQVPVPGDFEEAAAKAVTKDNYKEKLAELEQQIAGGPPQPSASASAAPSAAPSATPSAAPAPPAAP